MPDPIVIGEGVLTWRRVERVSDRYGAVSLMWEGGNSLARNVAYHVLEAAPAGQRGRLEAHVLATRKSTHIGDLFRGIFPTRPDVGEVIHLGAGTLFFEEHDDRGDPYAAVGLRPTTAASATGSTPARCTAPTSRPSGSCSSPRCPVPESQAYTPARCGECQAPATRALFA